VQLVQVALAVVRRHAAHDLAWLRKTNLGDGLQADAATAASSSSSRHMHM
jgi:hypothetical protein